MNRTEKVDRTIRHYLLGELTEPEQAALESEYFGDKDKFEEVCAIENDLIDDYLRGNLPAADREHFEERYSSSPERLRRIQFARSMLQSLYGTSTAAPARVKRIASAPAGFRRAIAATTGRWHVAPTPLLAALALILAVATGLLGLEGLRLRRALVTSRETITSQSQEARELERQLAEQRASSDQLAKDLDTLRAQKAQEQARSPEGLAPIIASFILRPGLIRGTSEPQTLLIPPGVDVVELRLNLTTVDFKDYAGNLLTPEGAVIWKGRAIRIRPSRTGGTAFFRVPTKLLPPRDYILRVDGVSPAGESSEVADSYFRVAKKTGTR